MVKTNFWKKKYIILDNETRIRHGFSLQYFGITYILQRRNISSWKNRAWTYESTHKRNGNDLEYIIKYLKWFEEKGFKI